MSNQQVDPVGISDGALTDAVTGEEVSIRSHGQAVEATPNPEYISRYIQLVGKHAWADKGIGSDFHAEVSTLNDEVPIAQLDIDASYAESIFQGYQEGQSITVSVNVGGDIYTGQVASGVTYSLNGQTSARSTFFAASDQGKICLSSLSY
jgi:hypothetical protein